MGLVQSAVRLIYPDQCIACRAPVEGAHGLCANCWKDMPFIIGLRCTMCSQPLLGDLSDGAALCDACLESRRPWVAGRAALLYEGSARRMILGFKHSDRTDFAKPAARWMTEAADEILSADPLIVPVPIHWRRLLRRRYNQAAELAREIAALSGARFVPDALRRVRATAVQDGMTVEDRAANMAGAISATRPLTGQSVVVVDDVMTSGATLTAASGACLEAGAKQVSVLVLARVAKSP